MERTSIAPGIGRISLVNPKYASSHFSPIVDHVFNIPVGTIPIGAVAFKRATFHSAELVSTDSPA